MTTSEIKIAVMNLSQTELVEFLDWLDNYQESMWDKQIEDDMKTGKLQPLIEKARQEFRAGKCRPI